MGTSIGMAGKSLAEEDYIQERAALVEHGYSITWSARARIDSVIVRLVAQWIASLERLPVHPDGALINVTSFRGNGVVIGTLNCRPNMNA